MFTASDFQQVLALKDARTFQHSHINEFAAGGYHMKITVNNRAELWISVSLCLLVVLASLVAQLVRNRPDYAQSFSPDWLPFAAAGVAITGIALTSFRILVPRLVVALVWVGFLLMIWLANGLPLDLLRLTPLMPPGVDWPGMVTRSLALATAVSLARRALACAGGIGRYGRVPWYGYAAFAFALPYPILRTVWVLGGSLGLEWRGAAGEGFATWLACTPWLLAAALSLLLITKPRWIPRRLLLAAGYGAAAVVATFGPAAFWSVITALATGRSLNLNGIESWVPCLFYGSWFLWSISAAATTRSFQLNSAPLSSPFLSLLQAH